MALTKYKSEQLKWNEMEIEERGRILKKLQEDLEEVLSDPAKLEGWKKKLDTAYKNSKFENIPAWLQSNIVFNL